METNLNLDQEYQNSAGNSKTPSFLGKNNPFNVGRSIQQLRSRIGAVQSKKVMDKNTLNKVKIDMINRVFSLMKELGVDPSDANAVNSFLQQLEQQDPDLFALFEGAMNGMIGEEPVNGGAPENPSLMNKFSNLQQGIMRR